MSRLLKRVTVTTAVVGVAVLLIGAGCYAVGLRVGTSKSISPGLYITTNAAMETGAYVAFCPPPVDVFYEAKNRGYIGAGFCPGGLGFMMKRVFGVKGDAVAITASGVTVNGVLLPYSAPLLVDGGGRPMMSYPADHYTLDKDELLLMSDVSNTSFDGRYFGPINRAQIKDVIRPLFTW